MGLRETLNKNPIITTSVTGGIILICLIVVLYSAFGGGPSSVDAVAQGYYSTDDGKTFFPENLSNVPPFDHEGQPAVRAYVYRCGNDGTPFVGYLERYSPGVHDKVVAAKSSGDMNAGMDSESLKGREVKRPGDANWLNVMTPKASELVANVKCPDGSTDVPQMVMPTP